MKSLHMNRTYATIIKLFAKVNIKIIYNYVNIV